MTRARPIRPMPTQPRRVTSSPLISNELLFAIDCSTLAEPSGVSQDAVLWPSRRYRLKAVVRFAARRESDMLPAIVCKHEREGRHGFAQLRRHGRGLGGAGSLRS